MRYQVKRSHDSMGNMYATGPLVFLETDALAEAEREVIARGGWILDTEKDSILCDGVWQDREDSSQQIGIKL